MKEIFNTYLDRLNFSLQSLNFPALEQTLGIIRKACESGETIWIAGNGGSAATASHFATDLSRCSNSQGQPVKSISLCDNSSLITAIGNDFGFDQVFSRQVGNLARANDLLIVISASGNSPNLLKALERAQIIGITTISITGFDGGAANRISNYSIHLPTVLGDYGVAEDSHSIMCHFISAQMRNPISHS